MGSCEEHPRRGENSARPTQGRNGREENGQTQAGRPISKTKGIKRTSGTKEDGFRRHPKSSSQEEGREGVGTRKTRRTDIKIPRLDLPSTEPPQSRRYRNKRK